MDTLRTEPMVKAVCREPALLVRSIGGKHLFSSVNRILANRLYLIDYRNCSLFILFFWRMIGRIGLRKSLEKFSLICDLFSHNHFGKPNLSPLFYWILVKPKTYFGSGTFHSFTSQSIWNLKRTQSIYVNFIYT